MKKLAVIYWSGTGNTQMMALALAQGAQEAGGEVFLQDADTLSDHDFSQYDALALGCPAMGAEELEESVFEPFYENLKPLLNHKPIALFGSYDWGDGEWTRLWEDDVRKTGALLCHDQGLTVPNTPQEEDLEQCRTLGKDLASQIL